MLAIEWPRILEYIAAKDAALVSSFRGVARRDIEQCAARFSVTFPASYVEFLLAMGEDSGDLGPLGATQGHRFSDLAADFPPTGYPSKRLFKVSYETDVSALVFMSKFLDLAHADAEDAQVVEFETGEDAGASFNPGDFTFGEVVVREVFGALELYRRKYAANVFLSFRNKNGLAVKQSAVEALVQLGFGLVMPDLASVGCLNRDSLSVLVSAYNSTQGVDLRIGSGDFGALEELVVELSHSLPDSEVIQAPFDLLE